MGHAIADGVRPEGSFVHVFGECSINYWNLIPPCVFFQWTVGE